MTSLWSDLDSEFGNAPSTTTKPTVTKAAKLEGAIANDPVAMYLQGHGYVKSVARDGSMNIVCPFEGEHTTETNETEARYWPAHTGGYAQGHFKCLHAHCADRTRDQFLERSGYIEGEFEDLTADGGETPKTKRFESVSLDIFAATKQTSPSFIKGVLPRAELGVVYGEPGSGKSFFLLDMALTIARGTPWGDHRVTPGRVTYIVAEGASGFARRGRAYALHHNVSFGGIPFRVIDDAPNFMADDDRLLARRINEADGTDLIIVDTLAQCMPGGNENSSEGMGLVVSRLRRLSVATGAMVLLIHHSGKDASRGARGWSGLKGACDFELEIRRDGSQREAVITKAKDDIDGAKFPFELRVVRLGEDEDGDPVTSCAVEVLHGTLLNLGPKPRTRKAGGSQRLLLDLIHELVGAGTIDIEELLGAAVDRKCPGGSPEQKNRVRQNLRVVLDKLSEKDQVSFRGDRVQLSMGDLL